MNDTCSMSNCEKHTFVKGLCKAHYHRAWKLGTLPVNTPPPLLTGFSLERVKSLLAYESDTGIFRWKPGILSSNGAPSGKRQSGSRAGNTHYGRGGGYRYICIDYVKYFEHRLAWLWVYGEWPPCDIDHIDGDGCNNRINNLRLATRSQNNANSKLRINNTSGLKGVSLNSSGKWVAQVQKDYHNITLGPYATKEEAHDAYARTAAKLFKEFARMK